MSRGGRRRCRHCARPQVASPLSNLVRPGTGVGMRNVRERMAVLYGDLATVDIISRPGRGTKVTLLMPIVTPAQNHGR